MNKNLIRKDFPILDINKKIYLNSAFTTLTPDITVKKINNFYNSLRYSPVGPMEFEMNLINESYEIIARFIGTNFTKGIAFTSSCTEAINWLAQGLQHQWSTKDNIVITQSEYLPNVLPWVKISKDFGVEIRIIPVIKGVLDLNYAKKLIDDNTVLVSVVHTSNFFGTTNPIKELSEIAHMHNALLNVDVTQSITHIEFSVASLGCDSLVFSGHKALGPVGSGILWISPNIYQNFEPVILGDSVAELEANNHIKFKDTYERFWGGMSNTPNILGLAESLKYVEKIGIKNISESNKNLSSKYIELLSSFDFLDIWPALYGTTSIISFFSKKEEYYDTILNEFTANNIIIQDLKLQEFPYLQRLINKDRCLRISIHLYNIEDEILAVKKVLDSLSKKIGVQ